MHKLSAVLYQTESLIWVILLASFIVDEVLLDVSCLVSQLFLFFINLVLSFLIAHKSRLLSFFQIFKSTVALLTHFI